MCGDDVAGTGANTAEKTRKERDIWVCATTERSQGSHEDAGLARPAGLYYLDEVWFQPCAHSRMIIVMTSQRKHPRRKGCLPGIRRPLVEGMAQSESLLSPVVFLPRTCQRLMAGPRPEQGCSRASLERIRTTEMGRWPVHHEEEVRLIAYSIWEDEDRPNGCDLDHWFRAEAIGCDKESTQALPVADALAARRARPRAKRSRGRSRASRP